MVCYLCHREVESNLFLLNRTVFIFPNQPHSLPSHIDSAFVLQVKRYQSVGFI